MFSSFSSFTTSLREINVAGLAGDLVTHAQAGLKNAEGLVDHALGLPPLTAVAPAAAAPAATASATPAKETPATSSSPAASSSEPAPAKPDESAPAASTSSEQQDIDAARIAEMLDEAVPSSSPDENEVADGAPAAAAESVLEPEPSAVPVRKAVRASKASRLSAGSDSLTDDAAPSSEKKPKKPKKSLLAVAAIPSSPEAAPALEPAELPAPVEAVIEEQPVEISSEVPASVHHEETVAAGAAVDPAPDEPSHEPEPAAVQPSASAAAAPASSPVASLISDELAPAASAPVEASPTADHAPARTPAAVPSSVEDSPLASSVLSPSPANAVAAAAPVSAPVSTPVSTPKPPRPQPSSARATPSNAPAPLTIASPANVTPVSSATSAHSAAATPATPIIPSTPIPQTPSAAVIAADPSAALQAALDRARHAEDVSSKLTRLLKIRELQLEKQQLESSRITDELRKSEESSTRLADELRRSEEKSLAQQGAAERDRERLERRFNELNKQLTEEKARSAALASASNSSVQSARAKADNAEATALALVAKDQQIAAVMAEGAELQRKQQKLEIIIKKLREEIAAKEEIQKKSDAERESQEKRLADRTAKFTDLKERYSRVKEDLLETNQRLAGMESKLLETESLLSSSTSTVSDLRYSLQHAQDEKREKENALLKVQHELAQQHKTKAHSSEELEQLKAKDVEAQEREANLLRNVQEMNDALQAERAERAAREEVFQVELQAERTKLSDAEHRNEELLSAVPAATRPLLRQIESYASALQSSKEAWAGVEAQLNRRVHELELQLVHASREAKEHESSSRESALELADTQSRLNTVQEKLTALESAHRTLKSQYRTLEENSRDSQGKQEDLLHQILTLTAANDDLKSKVRSLTEGNASQERKWEGLYQSERQRSEKMEKEVEQLRAAGVSAGQSINTSDSSRDENKLESSPRSSVGGSSSADPWGSSNGSSSVAPLFGSDKLAVTSTVEMLRSLLHQKEGEIRSLKEINRQVESGRSSLSDELVLLTSQLNAASIGLARLPPLEAQLASLTQRYDAAVLLLGEKEETIDDLQQDVAEMKSVFQSQVEQLTTTIQELKKQKA